MTPGWNGACFGGGSQRWNTGGTPWYTGVFNHFPPFIPNSMPARLADFHLSSRARTSPPCFHPLPAREDEGRLGNKISVLVPEGCATGRVRGECGDCLVAT